MWHSSQFVVMKVDEEVQKRGVSSRGTIAIREPRRSRSEG
jgi:hypothetical protein